MFIDSSPGRWSNGRDPEFSMQGRHTVTAQVTYIKGKVIEISNNVSGPFTKSSTLAILARGSL